MWLVDNIARRYQKHLAWNLMVWPGRAKAEDEAQAGVLLEIDYARPKKPTIRRKARTRAYQPPAQPTPQPGCCFRDVPEAYRG